MKDIAFDVTTDLLILLVDILGACDRVMGRAGARVDDARLARIRDLARRLEETILHYWGDLQVHEAVAADDDDNAFDDNPFLDLDDDS